MESLEKTGEEFVWQ